MKNFKITNISKVVVVLMTMLTFTVSCTFDEEFDPNRTSLEGVLTDASENQLNNLGRFSIKLIATAVPVTALPIIIALSPHCIPT